MKNLFCTLLFVLTLSPLLAQIDKEFWFVGPEASANHGDKPVYVRVSTMENAANIKLRMPANPKFVPIQENILPYSTVSIRLDQIDGNNSWLDSIENRPADQVLRKGLLLTSDSYVTAYYEINNGSNPAIFPMKGKNGVGTEFYIPGQTDYPNHVNNGSEAFDIVATQDTTTITITPSIDIVGHPANVPFQIVLHKGQSYSARTLITTAEASLAGSHVVSDKPIAITISDDSIVTGGWDIIGDQLIPVNLLGMKYIVIKGFADNNPPNNNDERVYITATMDNTVVYIDGDPVPVATLSASQQYDYAIPPGSNTAFIHTSKPAYVYHLTGHSGEAGASILPQDSCTGSRNIGFNRSSNNAFALLILTRDGNQDYFTLNGDAGIITGANFNVVPGTNGEWVFYRQNNLTTAQVRLGANYLVNSHGKFHLGILNNVSASSEYGYFSDFSTLYLGSDANICPGDSMLLDGGPYRDSYEWKKLISGVWTPVGTMQTYLVTDTGYYACMTNGDFCTLLDTIHISFYPNATVNLGADQTICEGTTVTFSPGTFQNYLWSNGTAATTMTTGIQDTVWVRVLNNNGCIATDTVMVYVDSLPLADHPVTGPVTVCQGATGVIYYTDTLRYATSYLWTLSPGATGTSTTKTITVTFSTSATPGTITVHGHNQCGDGPDVILPVTVNPLPVPAGSISGPNEVCQGQTGVVYSVPPIAQATSYFWTLPAGCTVTSGAGSNTITVSFSASAASGDVTVAGTNTACGAGLSASLPILTGLLPVASGPITGLTSVCQGQTDVVYSIASVPGATSYIWTAPPGGVITAGQGTNAVTISFDSTATLGSVTVIGHSGCGDGPASSVSLTINPLPVPAGTISGLSTVCQSQNNVTYSIVPLSYTGSYLWTVPSGCTITSGSGTSQITVSFNTVAISGPITVRGINATCGAGRRNSINILVNPLPGTTGTISGMTTVCQGEPGISYTVTSPDPNTLSYAWNLSPSNAGTVSSSTSPATVSWAELFTGQAFLTVAGMNGCGAGPVSNPLSITINPKPTVALAACFDLKTTKNSRPIRLSGGNPLGTSGIFSGTGVSQISPGVYAFDPGNSQVTVSAGGTPYEITYRYTNTYNCFREASRTITVFPSGAGQICPGTVTDLRDGQVYPTLLAGSGAAAKCWMARNLNYGEFLSNGQPQTDNCTIEKYCRNNLPSECSGYGGFYQWDELMQYQSGSYFQDLCPPGWHLPSEAEWTQFLASLGTGVSPPDGIAGSFLKDPNTSPGHFNALLGGVFYHGQSWALTTGTLAGTLFWTSTLTADDRISLRGLNYNNPSVSRYFSTRDNALPVRCVRD